MSVVRTVIRALALLVAFTFAASAATHAYWRVFVAGGTSFFPGMEELQFYDASGAYLPTGGTATSSSNQGGVTAANGFDSNFATFWGPAGSAPIVTDAWLQYHFASPVDVATVRIVGREFAQEGPNSVLIQYSDSGSSWTDATVAFTPIYGDAGDDAHPNAAWSFPVITPASGFYPNWRARPTGPSQTGHATVRCAELSLRGTVGGPNLADSTFQYMIGIAGGSIVFDGDPSTQVLVAAPGDGSLPGGNWMGYVFPKPVVLRQVCWTMPNSGGTFANGGPTSVAVEGSNDGGTTWVTAWTGNFGTWTADGQTQCLTQIFTTATVRVE